MHQARACKVKEDKVAQVLSRGVEGEAMVPRGREGTVAVLVGRPDRLAARHLRCRPEEASQARMDECLEGGEGEGGGESGGGRRGEGGGGRLAI